MSFYIEGKDKEEEEEIWKICWDEESVQRYKENVEKLTWEENSQGTIEEKWDKLKGMVQVAMIRKKVAKRKIELGQKDWWDRQCSKKKREVRRCYKKWRKDKIGKEKYMEERRKLKELAERKQREKREGEEKELKNLRNPTEVWRFINRKRKTRTWKEAEISKEVWRSYFMELLEGNETQKGRVNRKEKEIISTREERIEGQLEEKEIGKAVRKLKMKKAVGVDIPSTTRNTNGILEIRRRYSEERAGGNIEADMERGIYTQGL